MKREQIIEILERFITESDDYPDCILKYNFSRVADDILALDDKTVPINNLSGIEESDKTKLIEAVTVTTAEVLFKTFYSLGLKTHIESRVINDKTGEEFILSFKKIDKEKE